MSYCDYCGSGYYERKCVLCQGAFDYCMCEFGRAYCENCQALRVCSECDAVLTEEWTKDDPPMCLYCDEENGVEAEILEGISLLVEVCRE